jgi:hypothetical protein
MTLASYRYVTIFLPKIFGYKLFVIAQAIGFKDIKLTTSNAPHPPDDYQAIHAK